MANISALVTERVNKSDLSILSHLLISNTSDIPCNELRILQQPSIVEYQAGGGKRGRQI